MKRLHKRFILQVEVYRGRNNMPQRQIEEEEEEEGRNLVTNFSNFKKDNSVLYRTNLKVIFFD